MELEYTYETHSTSIDQLYGFTNQTSLALARTKPRQYENYDLCIEQGEDHKNVSIRQL